ncbi:MAG: hypothetical protein LBS71_01265 [Puniceicoccales bacterium]|jgi:hypothetical protein|nr:hypothetical protein [Puniceicoccales bacterium]
MMKKIILILMLFYSGGCGISSKPSEKRIAETTKTAETILMQRYPNVKLNPFIPIFADKYSYQNGLLWEFEIPGSGSKIVKMSNLTDIQKLQTLLTYIDKYHLSEVPKYLLLPEFYHFDPPFHVTAKAEGEDFDAFNRRFYGGNLDTNTYLQACRSLGEIFAYFHNHAIYHWDPHSSNIFFSQKQNSISIIDNDEVVISDMDHKLQKHIYAFKIIVLKTSPFGVYITLKYGDEQTRKKLSDIKVPYEHLREAIATFLTSYFSHLNLTNYDKTPFMQAIVDEIKKRFGYFKPTTLRSIKQELLDIANSVSNFAES